MQLNIPPCQYSVAHTVGQNLWNILKCNTLLSKRAGNLQIKYFLSSECVFETENIVNKAFFFFFSCGERGFIFQIEKSLHDHVIKCYVALHFFLVCMFISITFQFIFFYLKRQFKRIQLKHSVPGGSFVYFLLI